MTKRALALALILLLVPSVTSAQQATEAPSFGTSNLLHVVAVVMGVLGTAAVSVGAIEALDCGSRVPTCDPDPWPWITLVGVVLVVASLAIGIAATELHQQTRAEIALRELGLLPSLWIDPHGGGARLSMRW